MAGELSSIEAFPRIWAIEALARSKQLNTAELIDLVRKTPELSDDVGKNARELVSFRILETLFPHRSQNDIASAYALFQRIDLDPSNSCEDVLHHVLQKIPASNLKCGSSEMLNWDVQSFIARKRDLLPVSALQKLKDAVLDSSHSIFASFKERSGLTVRTQCDDNIPGHGENSNGSGWRLEERSKCIHVLPDLNTSPSITENGVDELQEIIPDRDSLPSKRNRTHSTGGKLERETHKDQVMHGDCYDQYSAAKKFKQDIHITELTAVEKSITLAKDEPLANSSGRIVEYIDKEVCDMENAAEVEGMEMECSETHDAGNQHSAEKFKQDINITKHTAMMESAKSTGDGLLANSSERLVEHIDREGCNLDKEAKIGVPEIKHTDFANDGRDPFAALKMLAGSNDVVDAGDRNCRLQTPSHDNIDVNKSAEAQGRSNSVGKANVSSIKRFEEKASNGIALGVNEEHNKVSEAVNSLRQNLQENTLTGSEANNEVEHNQVLETASDGDEYHDERNDIASKKNAFLSSQCTYSEESLETQQSLCMKCNNSGKLLNCSSNTCPLVVHESCLGSAAKYDGDGKFYCLFCAYSRAISEYLGVKRKATLARKDLATFIGLKAGNRAKLSPRSRMSKQNQATGNDELYENNEANIDGDPMNEVDCTHRRPNEEDRPVAEPSTSSAGNSISCAEKVAELSHGELKSLEKENLEGEGKEQEPQSPIQPEEPQIGVQALHESNGDISSVKQMVAVNGNERQTVVREQKKGKEQEHQSPVQPEEQQIGVQALHESDGDISSEKQTVAINGNERETVVQEQKKVTHTPESSLHLELPNQKGRESSEADDEKSSGSKCPMRPGGQDKQCTYPAIPQLRRKRHPWTTVEVEKLEEGVKKFSSDQELIIPWRHILEFGAGVFEKGRTQVDLKDKWRNICRAGKKSK